MDVVKLIDLVKNYRYMCDYFSDSECNDCPFYKKGISCDIFDFECANMSDAQIMEWLNTLEAFIAKNPRPIYPTYRELIAQFAGTNTDKVIDILDSEISLECANRLGVAGKKPESPTPYSTSEWR